MLDEQAPRRVVPRWRSSWLTAQTAEARTDPPTKEKPDRNQLAAKQLELDLEPSIPVASELMFLAMQTGDDDAAKRAASLIVKSEASISSQQLVHTAKRVLGIHNTKIQIPESGQRFIHEGRKILAVDYRNPVLLIDIARELTVLGHHHAALRYVRAAVSQAPHSRFVVRAAARYFLHIGDREQAHEVLKRSPLVRRDPWIQASEVAVATLRGKTSPLTKGALQLLGEQKTISTHLTELASAVATVELNAGSEKKARQLFQKSLTSPNDNSLAQAEWAANRLRLVVDDKALQIPLSFEANSHNAYRKLQIADAIDHAKRWSDDEPFASRPLDALCYLYSLEGRMDDARAAIQRALHVDGSDDFQLTLNLLFTSIQLGDLDAAHDDILRLARRSEAKEHAAQLLANAGALAYATGDHTLGRQFYERAIKAARAKGSAGIEALAQAFFARAAVMHKDPTADQIVAAVAKTAEHLPSPGAIYLVRTLVDGKQRDQLEKVAANRVAKRKWEWDAATNTLKSLE